MQSIYYGTRYFCQLGIRKEYAVQLRRLHMSNIIFVPAMTIDSNDAYFGTN